MKIHKLVIKLKATKFNKISIMIKYKNSKFTCLAHNILN